MNKSINELMANNLKKYPFLRSTMTMSPNTNNLSQVIKSKFNTSENLFFVFETKSYESVSIICLQEQNKIYINCECYQCDSTYICREAQFFLVTFPEIIINEILIDQFENAELVFNDMAAMWTADDVYEAIQISNSENSPDALIPFGYRERNEFEKVSNRDWKIIKDNFRNKSSFQINETGTKKKDPLIYVITYGSHRYSYSKRVTLSLFHLKKKKKLKKASNELISEGNIFLSDLKEAKIKINEALDFDSELDSYIYQRLRDFLLNRRANELRDLVGTSFSEFPLDPVLSDVVEKIARAGKLYFLEISNTEVVHLNWMESFDSNHFILDYVESKLHFELKIPDSQTRVQTSEESKVFQVPMFEINGNTIYKIYEERKHLLFQLSSNHKRTVIGANELEFFLDFLSEQEIYPHLEFSNLVMDEKIEVNPKLECRVELGASECSILPIMKYDEFGFEYNDLRAQYVNVDKKVNMKRKFLEENVLLLEISELIDFHQWGVSIPVLDAHEILKNLDDQKIPMMYKNKKLVVPNDFSFTASSGIDWIDLRGEVSFGDLGVIDILKLKSALNKSALIELESGAIGLLPSVFDRKYKNILELAKNNKDGSLRINKLHSAFLNTEALDELNITPDLSFEKFVKSFGVLTKSKKKISTSKLRDFSGELRKYQKEGLNWLETLEKEAHNGILADDMGLGKTVQVIAHISNLYSNLGKKNGYNTLIIVPKSLLFNWKNEFEKFAPSIEVKIISSVSSLGELSTCGENSAVYVVTYHYLRSKIEFFIKNDFDFIILDEAQNIKNEKSQLTRSILGLKGKRKLALTGTPIENSILDLASIFEFLYPGSMTPALKAKLDSRGPKKEREEGQDQFLRTFSIFLSPMILRRTKKQVLTDLPPKIEKNIFLEFNEKEAAKYNILKKAIQYSLIEEKGNKNRSLKMLEGILRLRQTCLDYSLINQAKGSGKKIKEEKSQSTKISCLIELLGDVIAEGSKAIVFSQFSSFLKIIEKELKGEGINTAYIDGATQDREAQVTKFKADKQCSVILCTLKTGGVGLNLTEAEYVFVMDPWWNPAAENQAIDRAHRIGQSKTVMIYKLVMKDSIEEKVIELQNLKKEMANSVLELGEEGLFRNLNKEEISSLFE